MVDEERQSGERGPQLVGGDRQELVARLDRLPSILEQPLAFLGDSPEHRFGRGPLLAGVGQILVQHEQAEQDLPMSGSASATMMSSVMVQRPAPISARCMRMRSVGLLSAHGTPGLLDRLGACHVYAHAGQSHAIRKQARHRAHQQVALDHDRDVRDARADTEHAFLQCGTCFRVRTPGLAQVHDVGESIPVARRGPRADRTSG